MTRRCRPRRGKLLVSAVRGGRWWRKCGTGPPSAASGVPCQPAAPDRSLTRPNDGWLAGWKDGWRREAIAHICMHALFVLLLASVMTDGRVHTSVHSRRERERERQPKRAERGGGNSVAHMGLLCRIGVWAPVRTRDGLLSVCLSLSLVSLYLSLSLSLCGC